MNNGQLIDAMKPVLVGVGVPESRIRWGVDVLLATVKNRAARGLPTYWEHIGLFSVIDCAARKRAFWRGSKKAGENRPVVEVMPPYRKLVFRRSVALNAVR